MVRTEAPSQATAKVMHERAGRAVDLERAGAAHAVLAAEVRSGEPAAFAQEVGEVRARLDLLVQRLAVHRHAHAGQGHGSARSTRSARRFVSS